jgi:hypothetical protein
MLFYNILFLLASNSESYAILIVAGTGGCRYHTCRMLTDADITSTTERTRDNALVLTKYPPRHQRKDVWFVRTCTVFHNCCPEFVDGIILYLQDAVAGRLHT